MHGSLLPKYRGRVPVNWAIIHGETETGATLHYMTEKPDDGDIVGADRGAHPARRYGGRSVRQGHRRRRADALSCAAGAHRRHRAQDPAGFEPWRVFRRQASPRTGASTGRSPRRGSTTWCAPWRRPIPARTRTSTATASWSSAPAWSMPEKRQDAAPQLRCADGHLYADCGAGTLEILACTLDGVPLSPAMFEQRFGAGAPLPPH